MLNVDDRNICQSLLHQNLRMQPLQETQALKFSRKKHSVHRVKMHLSSHGS